MRTFYTLTLATFYYLTLFPKQLPAQRVRSNGLLKEMNAECIKDGIKVHLVFQKPFHGVAYSYGHYDNLKCRYIEQDSPLSGGTNYTFLIPSGECGTIHHGNLDSPSSPIKKQERQSFNGSRQKLETKSNSTGGNLYIENMLLIQKDASIQEVGDIAQTIRCVFQQEILRPLVASLPFQNDNRRTSPSTPTKYTSPIVYQNRNTNNTYQFTPSDGRFRFESMKGQVQSVPHYSNYRKKWSRSLDSSKEQEAETQTNDELVVNENMEPELKIIALPLESNVAQASSSSQGLLIAALLIVIFNFK